MAPDIFPEVEDSIESISFDPIQLVYGDLHKLQAQNYVEKAEIVAFGQMKVTFVWANPPEGMEKMVETHVGSSSYSKVIEATLP